MCFKHPDLLNYEDQSKGLSFIKPLEKCCGEYLQVWEVEPLGGRNCMNVDRTCIVRCDKCGRKFISWYD